jgi:hypothetical protein
MTPTKTETRLGVFGGAKNGILLTSACKGKWSKRSRLKIRSHRHKTKSMERQCQESHRGDKVSPD